MTFSFLVSNFTTYTTDSLTTTGAGAEFSLVASDFLDFL